MLKYSHIVCIVDVDSKCRLTQTIDKCNVFGSQLSGGGIFHIGRLSTVDLEEEITPEEVKSV